MTTLEIGLAVGLGLALLAVVLLGALLPRRIARFVIADQARGDTRALAAKAALHAASSAEVAVIVQPLRALLEEQARQAIATREHSAASVGAEVQRLTATLRGLVEWLAAFAGAQYAQAVAATATAPETTRKADRAAPSRERPSPRAPAIAPPGSAEPQSPEPAQRAAGLMSPALSSRPPAAPAMPAPISGPSPRRATMLGVAPPATRRVQPSAPTLASMKAVAPPVGRGAPSIRIEGGDETPGGGDAA